MTIHPALLGRTCYHRYEVEPGLFTPGDFMPIDPTSCLDELGVPRDLSGLRALDIGAWDGPYTFELERRGAEVTALDIQDPDITVFNAVKKIKKSSATHVRCSIYDAFPEARHLRSRAFCGCLLSSEEPGAVPAAHPQIA